MIFDRYGIEVKKEEVIEILETCMSGATIYGFREARIIRAIDETEQTHGLISIFNLSELERILGVKFDGAKQLPYFGAMTTDKGKKWLKTSRKENK